MPFIEINNNLLVNVEEIVVVQNISPGGQVVMLNGGKTLEISESEASNVKKLLKQHKLILGT